MKSTDEVPRQQSGQSLVEYSFILAIVGLVAIIFMALLGAPIQRVLKQQEEAISIPQFPTKKMSELPLTDHAKESHMNQQWNALTARANWDRDNCITKTVSYCMKDNTFKAVCQVEPNLWVGLIVSGNDGNPIVTGFSGKQHYWDNVVRNCIPVSLPF